MNEPSAAITPKQVDETLGSAQRYWAVDGIPEIGLGGFWLIWSALMVLPKVVAPLKPYSAWLLIAGMLAMAVLLGPMIRGWKQRVTFPRTGFVEMKKPTMKTRFVWIASGAILGGVFGAAFGYGRIIYEWNGPISGVVMSAAMLQMAWKLQSPRLAWMAPLVAVAGFAAVMMGRADISIAAVLAAAGIIFVVDGLLTYRTYVAAHPEPAGEQP